jgi:hypothetical protein
MYKIYEPFVKTNKIKGGAGNTYMPLHDHPYSDVNIIYSVVQTGERTWFLSETP